MTQPCVNIHICIYTAPLFWNSFPFKVPQVEFSVRYSRFSLMIYFTYSISSVQDFPGGASGIECACQCRRHRFDPSVGKIPWRRAWQSTPVFLPREPPRTEKPGGLQSTWSHGVGHDGSDLARKYQWCVYVNTNFPIPPTTCFPPLVFIDLFSTSVSLFLVCK